MSITGTEPVRWKRNGKKTDYSTVSILLQQELNRRLREDYVQYQYLPVPQLYVSELELYEVKNKNILSRTVHSLAHTLKGTMDSLRRVLNKNK